MKSSGYDDEDWMSPDAPWRSEPATDKQRKKLAYFGIEMRDGITKGEASELIDEAIDANPELEEKYQAEKDQREEEEFELAVLDNDFNDDDMREMHRYRLLTTAELRWLMGYLQEHPEHAQLSRWDFGELIPKLLPSTALDVQQDITLPPLHQNQKPRRFNGVLLVSGAITLLIAVISIAVRRQASPPIPTSRGDNIVTPSSALRAPQPEVHLQAPRRSVPTGPLALAAQKRAIAKYPDLGVAGSQWNRTFVVLVERLLATEPQLFDDPEWPTKIADRIAKSEQLAKP